MGKRVDFTTTDERIAWLKSTAARQEISVSQLLNRLIRNRMKNEDRYLKKTTTEVYTEVAPKKLLNKEELLKELYEDEQDE